MIELVDTRVIKTKKTKTSGSVVPSQQCFQLNPNCDKISAPNFFDNLLNFQDCLNQFYKLDRDYQLVAVSSRKPNLKIWLLLLEPVDLGYYHYWSTERH